jgi:DNA-directed RNA polymerase specialized sigma24 family protein
VAQVLLAEAGIILTVWSMFPNTQWTELAHATLHGNEAGRTALEALCRNYWEPIRQFTIQRGWSPDEAPDLAQSFFVYLFEKGMLSKADREKGRFRSFLQGVLNHFLLTERDRRLAGKRGGGQMQVELLEDTAATDSTAEREFDRNWALAIMQTALAKVSSECAARRGDGFFETIAVYIGGKGPLIPQDQAAERLGMAVGSLRSEIHAWRQKLREHIRAEVRRTVSAPHEVDEEMNYLWQLLSAA